MKEGNRGNSLVSWNLLISAHIYFEPLKPPLSLSPLFLHDFQELWKNEQKLPSTSFESKILYWVFTYFFFCFVMAKRVYQAWKGSNVRISVIFLLLLNILLCLFFAVLCLPVDNSAEIRLISLLGILILLKFDLGIILFCCALFMSWQFSWNWSNLIVGWSYSDEIWSGFCLICSFMLWFWVVY